MAQLLDVPGLREQPQRVLERFVRLMRAARADPALVGAVISFESRWNPKAVNPLSGAIGLIQWTKSGASSQGTTQAAIGRMGVERQLALVADWYGRLEGKDRWREVDYYLAIFAPAFIGEPLSTDVYAAPSQAYEQNAALDVDNDGVITVGNIVSRFGGFVANAAEKPRVAVSESRGRYVAAAILSAALLGGAYYAERRGWL